MIRLSALVALLLFAGIAVAGAADETLSAAASQAYLAANAKKPGVITRPDGLQYKVLHSGIGKHPGPSDVVRLYFSGRFINGALFDGTSPGLPATLAVNTILQGLSEALQMMQEGDHWQIVVPPSLGFDARSLASGAVPPDQALVFDITLLSTNVAARPDAPDTGNPLTIATAGREQKAVLTLHP